MGMMLGAIGMVNILSAFRSWILPHAAASEKQASASHGKGIQQGTSHDDYMRQAIAMAQKVPKFPFGAVIIRRITGELIAKGFNRSSENPTFHGEIDAINRCASAHSQIDWTELDLYTTAEPCPMCQSAIEWAGITTVYYGSSIPYLQSHGWRQIDIRAEEVARRTPFRQTNVIGGILEFECNTLFEAAHKSDSKT